MVPHACKNFPLGWYRVSSWSAAAMAAFLPVSLPTSFHAATQVGLYRKPMSWWSTSTLRAMRSAKLST